LSCDPKDLRSFYRAYYRVVTKQQALFVNLLDNSIRFQAGLKILVGPGGYVLMKALLAQMKRVHQRTLRLPKKERPYALRIDALMEAAGAQERGCAVGTGGLYAVGTRGLYVELPKGSWNNLPGLKNFGNPQEATDLLVEAGMIEAPDEPTHSRGLEVKVLFRGLLEALDVGGNDSDVWRQEFQSRLKSGDPSAVAEFKKMSKVSWADAARMIREKLQDADDRVAESMDAVGDLFAHSAEFDYKLVAAVGKDGALIIRELFSEMNKHRKSEAKLPQNKRLHYDSTRDAWRVEIPGCIWKNFPQFKGITNLREVVRHLKDDLSVIEVDRDEDCPGKLFVTVDIAEVMRIVSPSDED